MNVPETGREAAEWGLALIVVAWFVLHFFLRSCTRAGCYDTPLAWFVTDHFGVYGDVMVGLARTGELILFGIAVMLMLVAGVRSRL